MDMIAKKCCIRFDPPTLILYYELPASGKIHRRSIPIKGEEFEEGDSQKLLENLLTTHHTNYIKKFKKEQLLRLLKMLIEKQGFGMDIKLNSMQSTGNKDSENIPSPKTSDVNLELEDLNKLGDEELNQIKKEMNYSFEENRVKPGDDNWKYDIEVDFEENVNQVGNIESAGWDDDSDMEF